MPNHFNYLFWIFISCIVSYGFSESSFGADMRGAFSELKDSPASNDVGWYKTPFNTIDIVSVFKRHHPFIGHLAYLQEKRWFYFSFFNDKIFVDGAVVDIGYHQEHFLVVYDRISKRSIEFAHAPKLGISDGVKVSDSSILDPTYYTDGGANISIVPGERSWDISLRLNNDSYQLTGLVTVRETADHPLVNLRETKPNRLIYTHQNSNLAATGELTIKQLADEEERQHSFSPEQSRGMMDFTRGFHPHKTGWHWASACSLDSKDGPRIAINFARDIVDSDDTSNNVWVYWIGTEIFRSQSPIMFNEKDGQYEINGEGISLVFVPEQVMQKTQDFVIVGSNYKHFIGTFEGIVADHQVKLFGVLERHEAKW